MGPDYNSRACRRESMQYDVVVVGAGPAGLAAAIRAEAARAPTVSVCVLEKGSELGAHILSGAVMDPRALDELIPDWKEKGAPLNYAGHRRPLPVPDRERAFVRTPELRCCRPASRTTATTSSASATSRAGWASRPRRWASRSSPASPPPKSCMKATAVKGVATGDMGIGKDGEKTDAYQPGMELHGKYTFFAEGCRGQLGRQLEAKIQAARRRDPQVYGIGLKELWEVEPEQPRAGPRGAHRRLAARRRYLRRLVPLPPGEQPGRGRLRRRARLLESLPFALRGVPALQDASGDPRRSSKAASASPTARARSPPAACSRCRSSCSRRRADRRRRRLPQRLAHQGQPRRDQVRHARRRSGVRRAQGRPRSTTSSQPIPRRSERAGCTRSSTRRATSSRGCRRDCILGTLMVGIDQVLFRGKAPWTLHHHHADHETLKREVECSTDRVSRSRTACSPSTACPRCSSPTPTTTKTSRRT